MDRRTLLRHVATLTGAALTPALARSVSAAFEGETAVATNAPLSEPEIRLAGLLAEHIIPDTDTPGALAAGVDRYIARIVAAYLPPSEAAAYRDGLALLDRHARSEAGQRFTGLDETAQAALLKDLDEAVFAGQSGRLSDFWRRHKGLTVAGYYTAEIGATVELRPMPMGPYDADLPFDAVGRTWS